MGLLDGQTQQSYYDGNNFGDYQFTSLSNIINQFMVAYVGEDKIISKVKRVDVAFHAMRAMQELSFDTFKSCKAQEITVPATLQMTLPQDYVNYTKVSWVDSAGIKHIIYPTSKTSNPTNFLQDDNGDFKLNMSATFTSGSTNIVLDDIYNNLPLGIKINGPSIGTFTVTANFVADGVSVLQLTEGPGVGDVETFTPTSSFTETLTAYTNSGDLFLTTTGIRTAAITAAPWTVGNNIITFDNASDTSEIEIGMVINESPSFAIGTTVTGVNGRYVTLSSGATTSPGTASSLFFTSNESSSDTWASYKSVTPSENQDDYQDDTYWPLDGNRYGLDPQHAQANGSFYIDCKSGKIHFSSNISGKTVILDYISDSLGTDDEMQVHKFAEEAMYKWIAHAIISSRSNVPEYQVNRFKKERFAAIRTAKLRLSNIKLEEITQILRGKSKQIKH